MSHVITVPSGASSRPRTGPATDSSASGTSAAHVAEVLPGTTRGTAVSPVAPPPPRRTHALLAYVRRLVRTIRGRWQQAGTESALEELDARTLRDIGLDRSEISSMAAEWHGSVPATRIRSIRYSPLSLHC